jgi:hypothetical protein
MACRKIEMQKYVSRKIETPRRNKNEILGIKSIKQK